MNLGNEYTLVEKPAIDYLKSLGYSYIDGRKLTPENNERHSLSEVILPNRMKTSLQKLNPDISEENINKIIRLLQRPDTLGSGLLEINEKIYEYIVNLQLTVTSSL
ncbi:MAG: type I restriction endonuclease [Bacilli bacterium]